MQKYFIITIIFLSALGLRCEKENENKMDCTNVFCTLDFRSIQIQIIKSADSTAFLLTDFKVIRIFDNKDITIKDSDLTDNSGYYQLVNDSEVAMLRNKNVEIEFQGYLNKAIVITRRFVVTADCCHVSLVSGVLVVYL
jgi:hypothetical protein